MVLDLSPITFRTFARNGHVFAEFSDGTVLPVVRGGDGPTDDLDALLEQASNPAEVEDLVALEAALEAAGVALAESGTDAEVLAQLEQIAVAIEAVRTEGAERAATAEANDAAAAALLERIRGEQAPEDEPEPDDEPAEPAEPGETAEPVEVEVTVPRDEAELEPVAAAARPVRLGRVAARRPEGLPLRSPMPAQLPVDVGEWGLVASVEAPGVTPGQPIENLDQLANAWLAALELSAAYRGPRTKFPVFSTGGDPERLYGRNRYLGRDHALNRQRIDAVTAPHAVTAAGGRCAPSPVRYDMPTIGTDARPVRNDMMTRFGADRGGVKTFPPPTMADLDGAVGFWTEANDQNPSAPATKPCLTITCPDEVETVVEAVTMCLQVGEFRRRFFREQVEAWSRLLAVEHAREAEIELLTAIGDGSTQVNVGQGLGATRDILAGLDRALAAFTSRHRANSTTWRWGAPFWLLNMIRTDLAREMPGSADERLAMADAAILAIFRVHGVTPTFFLDGEAGQIFGAQGDGPLLGWPTQVVTYLYPEGSWLFLDGGTFEAGWFRDSGLIGTNDVKFFAETFEGAHFDGVESERLTFDVCPDGTTSGTTDFDPCAFGS